MKVSELLLTINELADKNNLSKPYIVGGLVRDRISKDIEHIHDVDITTGDYSVHKLAKIVSETFPCTYVVMPDSHARIVINDLKLDFSSNFKIPGITSILNKGIKNPSEMQKELFSRDFTCNAGLMTLDLKKVLDLTGKTISDIEDKIIRTCLRPELTLGYDNKRIVRAIYFAAKLDFDIDNKIIQYIKSNTKLIKNIDNNYIVEKVNKAIEYNKDKTIDIINEMGLENKLPYISSQYEN